MNSALLSVFVLVLVAASIQSGNGCGIFGKKCEEDEYCWRSVLNIIGICRQYGENGDACNEKRLCGPQLTCTRHSMWSSTCVEDATTASPTTIPPQTTSSPVVTKA